MAAFAWSPLRALMKKAGAEIVSRAAVDKLMDYLEEYAKQFNLIGLTDFLLEPDCLAKKNKLFFLFLNTFSLIII